MKEITDGMKARLERQISLIGEKKTLKLINASCAVIGLGGVGGYVCEMLARVGVGRLYLVDCDTVSVSNLNRQIIALESTVGKKKTDVMLERVKEINPECDAVARDVFITKDNAEEIISDCGCDVIIDCIDNVSAKIALVKHAKAEGKYVFSSMGTGNKLGSAGFCVTDISKTHTCGLAKAVRKGLRDEGIEHLDVLFSTESVVQTGQRVPSSIAYTPSVAGIFIAEHIIKRIISE